MQKKGSPTGLSKKFPCRGGESIRHRSTPTLSNRRLDTLSIPLSLSSSKTQFERIIIRGTRAHGLSSRGSRSPLFLLFPNLFRTSSTVLLFFALFSFSILVLLRFVNTRKKPRLTVDLLSSYTARPHAGGATVPHYHTIFMLAPPGPQSCTIAHYT